MAQRIIEERGRKVLLIDVSVRCKDHPTGRIVRKKRLDNVEIHSKQANAVERELLKEIQSEKGKREVLGVTWEVLLNLYGDAEYPKVLSGEHVQSKQTFNEAQSSLRNWTEEWFDKIASQILPVDVTRLFHRMKNEGISDSTLGKVRGDIKKVFEFGILHRHVAGLDRSPTTGVTIKSRKRMRTEILNEDEIKKLLKYAREYERAWYYIWSFAVYTGARNGELFALKWTDLDEKDRIITLQRSYNKRYDEYKGTKTDEWRKVSINSSLWAVIEELKSIRAHEQARGNFKYDEFVLPRPGVWQNGEQAKRLRMFCEEIGITPICFHSLRACFATELLKRGVPVPKVMRVGGWKSVKTMMHYVRLSGIDERGVTDPLDFESSEPNEVLESRRLMEAVGEKFEDKGASVASVIPLATRRHPGLATR